MSEIWEKNISEWYANSNTSSLKYLDLISSAKPSSQEIANNLAVCYDRICLSSKVSLKHFKLLEEQIQELKAENQRLTKALSDLTREVVENRPLTEKEVKKLVKQIVAQPKLVEQQTIALAEDLRKKIDQVSDLIEQVRHLVS
ncbi:ORF1 [Dioscorea bacilliform virus]|uniref:ORF1 n=1 Tax=Dioscorea bacilliform ES virus TaxID=2560408 RepID=A0A1Z2R8T1_9VIRU|nr:ORF1 [Dioscorea bacilliform virus]ASA40118.1 ORF1 [Dioscorea bacilliform ES virus]